MTLQEWLDHYTNQPQTTIQIEQDPDKRQAVTIYDEDSVIMDLRFIDNPINPIDLPVILKVPSIR